MNPRFEGSPRGGRNTRANGRNFDGNDRGGRGASRGRNDDRRSQGRDFGRDDRRSNDRGHGEGRYAERGERRFDERPRRSFDGDRKGRDFGDRKGRDFGDRKDRDFGDRRYADKGERRFDDRPRRSFDGDRKGRDFEGRGNRFDRDDRPRRSYGDRDDRPRRSYGDRDDSRSFNRDDRRERDFGGRGERKPRWQRDEHRASGPGTRAHGDRTRDHDRRRGTDRDETRPNWEPRGKHADRDSAPAFRTRGGDRRDRFDGDRAPRDRNRDQRGDRGYERRDSTYYPSKDAAPFVPQDDTVLERLEAQAISAEQVAGTTFADLGLGAGIVGALTAMGAQSPFPIQAATIPEVLAGRDVLGRGKTGSGKTIAFGAPLVEYLLRTRPERREQGRAPRALILAPTRELAAQIDRTVQSLARAVGIFTTIVTGGVRQGTQVQALRRGVDILIGTPGRIEDLVDQGVLNLGKVEVAVLDEADHMCDLGFLEPVQRILRMTRPDSQKLLFSATLDKAVAALVDEFLENPAVHEVAGEDQDSSTIDHRVLVVDRFDKDAVLDQIVRNPGRIVVFTRTRAYAERLAEQFEDAGVACTSLHGDLNQARRTRNLDKLKRGKANVLVATDVAARGIHVDDVALVVQADPPDEYKTYLHRAGRTGRAGNAGQVVTVVAPSRRRRMQQLLERAEIEAPMIPVIPGDDILDTLTLTEASEAEVVAVVTNDAE